MVRQCIWLAVYVVEKKNEADDEWKNTIMVVVDEISFITKSDFEKLNDVLNKKTMQKLEQVLEIYRWFFRVIFVS